MKKKSGGGASFDRRHVRPKHVVMGRAVQAQETRAGQKRSAAQDSRDTSLGFDLRRRARLSANVLVDHRTARTTPTAARRARAAQSDEERMLAQWHRERQRTRKYSLSDGADAEGAGAEEEEEALTHGGRVLGEREEDYHEMPEGRESDEEEEVLGHDTEDLSALYASGASVVERARARRAERQRERVERQRLAASLDDQFDAVAALVLEHKREKRPAGEHPALLPGDASHAETAVVPTLFVETGGDDDEEGEKKDKKEKEKGKDKKGKKKGKKESSSGGDDDDDFEALVVALGSEAKGRATDRTKRPEELAAERVAQLEALEAERVRRQAQTSLGGPGARAGGGGDDDDGVFDDEDEDEDDDDGGLGLAEMRRLLREQNRASADADDLAAGAQEHVQQQGQQEKGQGKEGSLPFTFGVPGSVAEWAAMSAGWGPRERELVVRRILACNHPSLAADNAARLTAFVGVLLDSVAEAAGPVAPHTADSVARSVVFLARELGGEAAARAFAPRLRACYASAVVARTAPSAGTLCVLKIAQDVFPVSDFRHVVATPLALLLAALLARATLLLQQQAQTPGCKNDNDSSSKSNKDDTEKGEEEKTVEDVDSETRERVSTGLYVCTLLLQYATENARYIPEVLAHLGAVLRVLCACMPAPQGPCVPLALPWTPAGAAQCTAATLDARAWTARATATALRLLGVAARAWVPMAPDAVLALRPVAQHVAQSVAPRLAACPEGQTLAQQTAALCAGEQQQANGGKEGKKEVRAFRTVERRNVVPIREFAPRIAETSLDQRQIEQERLRRLKRTLARERKALGREVKKDAAYTMRVLEQESADENRAIRAAHGRILNMLQDEQHEQKVEERQKQREKRRLRM